MTTYYVRSDAAGGGDGTTNTSGGANGAWTLAEALQSGSASFGGTDTLIIVADAAYTGIDFTLQSTSSTCQIFGANSSGVIDGTKPSLQWVTSGATITASSLVYQCGQINFLSLDFNDYSTSWGIRNTSCIHVDVDNSAVTQDTFWPVDRFLSRCSANGTGSTPRAFRIHDGVIHQCLATGSHTNGFIARIGDGAAIECVDAGSTTGFSTDGSRTALFDRCIYYRASTAGTGFSDASGSATFQGCIAENATTGYSVNSSTVLLDSYARNCTTDLSGTPSAAGDSSVTTTDPGLVDPTGTPPDFGTSARLAELVGSLPFEINGRTAEYAGLTQVIGGGSGLLPQIGSPFIKRKA